MKTALISVSDKTGVVEFARELAAHAATPQRLAPAIRTTILAANLYGVLTVAALGVAAH